MLLNIHIDINLDYKNIEKAKYMSTGTVSVQPKTSSLVLLNVLSNHIDYRNTEVLLNWWSLCPKTSSQGLFNEMINQFLLDIKYSYSSQKY